MSLLERLPKVLQDRFSSNFTISLVWTREGNLELHFNEGTDLLFKDPNPPSFNDDSNIINLALVAEEYGLSPRVSQRFYNAIVTFVNKQPVPLGHELFLLRDGTVRMTEIRQREES